MNTGETADINGYVKNSPNKLSFEENPKAEHYHVPVALALIVHDVQGLGHMTVAVITEEVVDSMAVDLGSLCNTQVPACSST